MAIRVANKLTKLEADVLVQRLSKLNEERKQLLELVEQENEILADETVPKASMVGERVQHKKFGIGIIVEDHGSTWSVDFGEYGVRLLDVKTLFRLGIANTSSGDYDEAVETNTHNEAERKRIHRKLLALKIDISSLERRLSGRSNSDVDITSET